MVNYISGLVFVVLVVLGVRIAARSGPGQSGRWRSSFGAPLAVPGRRRFVGDPRWPPSGKRPSCFAWASSTAMKGPGLFMIIPLIDQIRMVDTRVLTVNIPKQQVITRDNVPVTIDGVLFFRVDNAAEAIITVQDYRYMITQYSQTSLRDVIGQLTLDQLLTEREEIAKSIEQHVEKDTKGWGLEVTGIAHSRHRHARRAEENDVAASFGRAREAGDHHQGRRRQGSGRQPVTRGQDHGRKPRCDAASYPADDRRTGPTASNTVVLAVPIEILEYFAALKDPFRNRGSSDRSLLRRPDPAVRRIRSSEPW